MGSYTLYIRCDACGLVQKKERSYWGSIPEGKEAMKDCPNCKLEDIRTKLQQAISNIKNCDIAGGQRQLNDALNKITGVKLRIKEML